VTKRSDSEPLEAGDHDEQSLREADEKMLRREKEDVDKAPTDDPGTDDEHDPEALAEADRRMLLRDDET
jgi:hypothetical protein